MKINIGVIFHSMISHTNWMTVVCVTCPFFYFGLSLVAALAYTGPF